MFKKKPKELLIKKLRADAIVPKYMTKGAVAFDICAIENYIVYKQLVMVHTGIAVAIPEGYEINVRARSGLSLKHPNYIAIAGGGTIDSDYRGEIIVPVVNNAFRSDGWEIKKGERIAQCIVSPVEVCNLIVVDDLPETERGAGGFGHTGVK
jgi:dUTP pyrophosphatase